MKRKNDRLRALRKRGPVFCVDIACKSQPLLPETEADLVCKRQRDLWAPRMISPTYPRDTPSHQVVSPQKLWPHRYGASAASGTTHTPSARRNAGPVGTMTRSAAASGTTLAAAALR